MFINCILLFDDKKFQLVSGNIDEPDTDYVTCSGVGKCLQDGPGAICECDPGHSGKRCQGNPLGIYLLKVNNRNSRIRCEICSKLTIKTPEHDYVTLRESHNSMSFGFMATKL